MRDLKDLEPLSKFKHNPRMHQAVCQNCRMPQAHRDMMHKALQAPFKPGKVKQGTPVEKQPKGTNNNFYHVKPYPYMRSTY